MHPPSAGPRSAAPACPPKKPAMLASVIHGMSRARPCSSTVTAIGVTSTAAHSVHSGSATTAPGGGRPTSALTICRPTATPNVIARNTVKAPASRAVPETRCRAASSAIAIVSEKPGMTMMRPARVDTAGDTPSPNDAARSAAAETSADAISSNSPCCRRRRPAATPEQADQDAEPGRHHDVAGAAAEEAARRAGRRARGHRLEQRRERRRLLLDRLDAGQRLGRRQRSVDDGAGVAVDVGELAEAEAARARRASGRCAAPDPLPNATKIDVGVEKKWPTSPSRVDAVTSARSSAGEA